MDLTPLDKARELILSLSTPEDAQTEITKIEILAEAERQKVLDEFYNSAQSKAQAGDIKGISTMLRVFEHFSDRSHDRMLLHYIAEAEANYGLTLLKDEEPGEFDHKNLQKALLIISEAFADADKINKSTNIS